MTTTEQYILNYAYGHGTIVSADILKSAEANGISSTALNWHLRRLVSEKKLFRTGRGQYSVTGRQPFKESPDEELVRRHTELIGQYPTVRCCLYKGTIIAPLLLQKEIYPQKSLPNLQQLILCRLLKEFGL